LKEGEGEGEIRSWYDPFRSPKEEKTFEGSPSGSSLEQEGRTSGAEKVERGGKREEEREEREERDKEGAETEGGRDEGGGGTRGTLEEAWCFSRSVPTGDRDGTGNPSKRAQMSIVPFLHWVVETSKSLSF